MKLARLKPQLLFVANWSAKFRMTLFELSYAMNVLAIDRPILNTWSYDEISSSNYRAVCESTDKWQISLFAAST